MFDEPLPQADRHTLEMCIAQCDVLMQRNEQRRGITALVRTKLFRDSGCFPTLPDVAAELAVHPRTLRRRLAEEGTSFRALLNEARSAVAVDLLRNVGLTVEEVSTRLATPRSRRSRTRSNAGMALRPARIAAGRSVGSAGKAVGPSAPGAPGPPLFLR